MEGLRKKWPDLSEQPPSALLCKLPSCPPPWPITQKVFNIELSKRPERQVNLAQCGRLCGEAMKLASSA